jgi:hypothetical protein
MTLGPALPRRLAVDRYIVETLMPDLVGHDRQPAAFCVYLALFARAPRTASVVTVSHAQLAVDTGLSKSAVQGAVRTLKRRKLVEQHRTSITAVPRYRVLRPWRRA